MKRSETAGPKGRDAGQTQLQDSKIRMRSTREQLAYLLIFLIFVAVSIYVDWDSATYHAASRIPLESGWTLEDGTAADLSHLPGGPVTVRRNIEGQYMQGQALCLKSIDTNFDLCADGEIIYTYRPVIPKRLGLSYGMYVHTVTLPEGTKEVQLQLDPVFVRVAPGLRDVEINNADAYITTLFRAGAVSTIRSTINVLVGLLFLLVGIFHRILMKSAGLDFVSFGIMSLLVGLSGFNDTLLLQVMTQHPALVRVITYVTLILMPFPALSFFAGATGNTRSKVVPVIMTACLVNFAAQVILTHHGLSDYYYLVKISHAIILLTFGISIWFVVRAAKQKTIQRELLRCLMVGLVACAVGVTIDVVRFYFFQSYGSTAATRTGVFLFMILVGLYLFQDQTRALKRQHEESKTYIRELSSAFAKVIDMKDSYTRGHSARVAHYTAMLAKELGYDRETVDRYYQIALLHDIGKIGIPGSVLNKPGKLTDEEYQLIQSHTSQGYEALKDISVMPDLAVGAQAHHERPDGMGYPNGLKEGEIPRVAQIIAVADCFDAMYSDRPYRKRMKFEKVVSIIREEAGKQLTQDVVDAFLLLAERGEFRAKNDDGSGSEENIDNIRERLEREDSVPASETASDKAMPAE